VCIDIAYNVFERAVLVRASPTRISARTRHLARQRSIVVLALFTAAMLVALIAPGVAFALVCGALLLHLRPEAPRSRAGGTRQAVTRSAGSFSASMPMKSICGNPPSSRPRLSNARGTRPARWRKRPPLSGNTSKMP